LSKKIIFLVDHKHRDFPSLCLIGLFLENYGHKVFYKNIHEPDIEIISPDIVVEGKYSRPKEWIEKIKSWQKKNIKILVIETEGIHQGIGFLPLKNYFCNLGFFWNKYHGYKIENFEKKNFHILGSPRIDFFHKNLRGLIKKDKILKVLGINNKKKPIITLATTNTYERLSKKQIKNIKTRYYKVHKSNAKFEHLLLYQKESKNLFINFCKDILKNNYDFYLVIKPHPNEDIFFWKNLIKELGNDKRVKLMIGRPIQDLFSISNLHVGVAGCQTIAEAGLCNIKTIELNNNSFALKKIMDKSHLNLGLYNIKSFKEIKFFFLKLLNKKISTKIYLNWRVKISTYVNLFFYKFDGNRCYEYAKIINKYLLKKENFTEIVKENYIEKCFYFFIKLLKTIYRNIRYKKNQIDHRGRYDNRIKEDDIIAFYNKLRKINYVKSKIKKINSFNNKLS